MDYGKDFKMSEKQRFECDLCYKQINGVKYSMETTTWISATEGQGAIGYFDVCNRCIRSVSGKIQSIIHSSMEKSDD